MRKRMIPYNKKLKTSWLLLIMIGPFFISCGISNKIVDKPIVFDDQRIELTKEYKQTRYKLPGNTVTIVPRMVVLHHTVLPTFQETFEAFDPPTLPNWRPELENVSGLNVSSQFVVDRDGTIYRLMPETYMARHVIGLNHAAIGIENVGGTPDLPLTKAQEKANIKLVRYLAKKYPITYLIGHREYTNFEGHRLWLEVDDGYRTEKDDPSEEFLNAVRKATKNFNFKPVPEKDNP